MWRASFITKESNEFLWRCVMQNPRSRRCGYISDIIADSGFYIFPVSKIEFQSELSMTCIFYIFFEKNKKFCLHFLTVRTPHILSPVLQCSIRFNSGSTVHSIVIKHTLPPITLDTGSAINTPVGPMSSAYGIR